MPEAGFEQGLINFFNKALKPLGDPVLKAGKGILGGLVKPAKAEVVRENEFGLNQGKEKGGNNHQGYILEQLAQPSGKEEQGDKGNHACDDGKSDGHGHPVGTVNRGVQGGFAPSALGVYGLPNHDGIIHQDSQDHNKCKQGDQVDRCPNNSHGCKRTHEGNG